MNALHAVHDLSDGKVEDDARERERVRTIEAILPSHQVEHGLGRELGGDVEVLVEAERHPCVRDPRDGHAQLRAVLQLERELCALERALDRGTRDLAVALRAVSVACRDERAVDRNRQVEGRAGDEQLAVDVASPAPRRAGRVDAGLGRRHPDHAEERRERDGGAPLVGGQPVADLPAERRPVREGDTPATGAHLVDVHDERLPRTRSAHLDRPAERMPAVERAVTLGEELAVRLPPPTCVERGEDDRVAGVDGEHGWKVGREMAVHGAPLERELVDHQKASSLRQAATTRAMDGMYASSIFQYGYGTS